MTEMNIKRWLMAAFVAFSLVVRAWPALAQESDPDTNVIGFKLALSPKFGACAGDGLETPTAQVTVVRGTLNDSLTVTLHHLKPNLGFDLFTTQHTNLLSDGQIDPNFKNFGLAWYQSDVQADAYGNATASIRTILLDQIFGFDPLVNLLPTNTFHVGLWFNNPQDAVPCGFNAGNPTPFNGQHKAGPNAFITVPNPYTDLGPLCTKPIKGQNGFVCNLQ